MEMVTWNHDGYFIRHGHDYDARYTVQIYFDRYRTAVFVLIFCPWSNGNCINYNGCFSNKS